MRFRDFVATTVIPRQVSSHDCVDTGNNFNIIGGADPVKLTIDGAVRNKYNVRELFKNSNLKDTIVWSAMIAELNLKVSSANNSIFKITIKIPHPTFGDILVAEPEFLIFKSSTPQDIVYNKLLNQADDGDAHLYGFDFYVSCNNNATITNRSIISAVF